VADPGGGRFVTAHGQSPDGNDGARVAARFLRKLGPVHRFLTRRRSLRKGYKDIPLRDEGETMVAENAA